MREFPTRRVYTPSHEAWNNRITTSGITYDAMGNVTGDGTHTYTYTYDPEGRLIKVDGGSTAAYTYDAMGRRARRVVGSSTYDYVFDPAGHPFEEIIPPSTGNRYEVYSPIGRLSVYTSNTTYFYHAARAPRTSDP